MKTCPKCGYTTENEEAKFCKKCGFQFVISDFKTQDIVINDSQESYCDKMIKEPIAKLASTQQEENFETSTTVTNRIEEANILIEKGKNEEAVAIFKELSQNGDMKGQANYGVCLLKGCGIKQNFEEGIKWLQKSADGKNPWACLRLAEVYLGTDYKGKNIPVNLTKVAECLSLAKSYGAEENEIKKIEELTIPFVKFLDCKIQKDLKQNKKLGLELSFSIETQGLAGRKINFSVYTLYDFDFTFVLNKPGIANLANYNNSRCKYVQVINILSSSLSRESFEFFIPYSSILDKQGQICGRLVLMAWNVSSKKPLLVASEDFPFRISCTTHIFSSNDWLFELTSLEKRFIKLPQRTSPIAALLANKEFCERGKGGLPMDVIVKAANSSYSKPSLKALAVATMKIAEVIQERLPNVDVSYMVHPSEITPSVYPGALPIHFLFRKNGIPKAAVVAVTSNGRDTPLVQETRMACEVNGIKYIRVYADGTFSDWMHKDCDSSKVEFCKSWLVDKINDAL